MGCKLSKSYLNIVEPSSANQSLALGDISVMKSASELIDHIESRTNQNITCVFIFGKLIDYLKGEKDKCYPFLFSGGSGSNKGEFIFELFDERLNKLKDGKKWQYVYLHVETLIIDNIRARVDHLENGLGDRIEEFIDEEKDKEVEENLKEEEKEQDEEDEEKREKKEKENFHAVRKCLSEYSNAITPTWIRHLIEEEINSAKPGSKFVINLIPNQINLFKDSLYLKQGPQFGNFNHGYIAVNIISQSHSKKDVEVSEQNSYQEVNDFFVDCFKNTGKLIEIRIEPKKLEPKIRISRRKSAIKVKNSDHLEAILRTQKSNDLNLDITQFEENPSKGPLFFFENGQIIVGDEVISVDQDETNAKLIQHFVTEYLKVKGRLDTNQ